MDSMDRQLAMLRQIPRGPHRIDTTTLRAKLKERGYDVTLRTVQRDLNLLSGRYPLVSDDSKPQGWWWKKDAPVLDVPGLDPQAAMVFRMVEEHLKPLLPESTLDVIKPWFEAARKALNASSGPLSKWPEKVRILPKGMPLLPPRINPEVQGAVYQALLDERWLRISYRAQGGKEARIHEANPMAVVQRGPVIYLIATIGDYTEPVLMLLHRIDSAKVLERPAVEIDGFDLDRYIANGELNYRLGPAIQLVARFSKDKIAAVAETPLAEDQVIELLEDGWYEVKATVPDTHELRAWLRGFGDKLLVVAPLHLC